MFYSCWFNVVGRYSMLSLREENSLEMEQTNKPIQFNFSTLFESFVNHSM